MANPEDRLQAEIVTWIRETVPSALCFHVPNGGLVTPREASRRKWIGVVPGVPDLCILAPDRQAFFVEVKSHLGRLNDAQEETIARLRSMGFSVAIIRSLDEVKSAFAAWGVPIVERAEAEI